MSLWWEITSPRPSRRQQHLASLSSHSSLIIGFAFNFRPYFCSAFASSRDTTLATGPPTFYLGPPGSGSGQWCRACLVESSFSACSMQSSTSRWGTARRSCSARPSSHSFLLRACWENIVAFLGNIWKTLKVKICAQRCSRVQSN